MLWHRLMISSSHGVAIVKFLPLRTQISGSDPKVRFSRSMDAGRSVVPGAWGPLAPHHLPYVSTSMCAEHPKFHTPWSAG